MNQENTETEIPHGFKGVWIRASLWRRKDLSWFQKCLLAEIDNLRDGCFASNRHLAKIMGVPERTLTNNLSELRKKHLILDCGFDGRRRQIMVADCASSDPAHGRHPNTPSIDVDSATKPQNSHLPENGYAAYPKTGDIDTSLDSSLSKETKGSKGLHFDGQSEAPSPKPSDSTQTDSRCHHPPGATESNGGGNAEVYEAKWKPDNRTKEQKLASLRVPANFPSEAEFDRFIAEEGLTMVEGRDTYEPLCRNKWRQWTGRRWVTIRDWRAYVRALNEKMEEASQF